MSVQTNRQILIKRKETNLRVIKIQFQGQDIFNQAQKIDL